MRPRLGVSAGSTSRGALLTALGLWLGACGGDEAAQPAFVERSPLPYTQSPPAPRPPCATSAESCEPELFSGGMAVGDVDGDGRLDVFATRLGQPDLLFLGRGGLAFEEASAAWGLDAVAAASNGVALFDADRDGDLDAYVIGLGAADAPAPNDRYHFWRNEGGRFVEDAEARGLAFRDGTGRAGTSVAVGDFDADGWPDLHLTEWRLEVRGWSHERLLRNRGPEAPGHFEDVTTEAGVFLGDAFCREERTGCQPRSFASAFTDLDGDGWPDLVVASDFGTSRLFWNRGDGTFAEGTVAAGVGTDENGMGSTIGDVDGDGDLDWFVTSISDGRPRVGLGWDVSGNRLYRNEGGRRFVDATDAYGVRDGGWGWGAAFADLDHDGDLDLVMTNGMDQPQLDADDVFARDPMRLWVNEGGAMREGSAEAGLVAEGPGRGLCLEDADGDGDLDVLVVENGGGIGVFENVGAAGPFLALRAEHADGTLAYGARVEVAGQVRELSARAHFLCGSVPEAHFGLRRGGSVEAVVHWPGGALSRHPGLAVNARHALRRP
ncbi:MAG: VCBS repeat-containing protein [Myxococcota bacterium]